MACTRRRGMLPQAIYSQAIALIARRHSWIRLEHPGGSRHEPKSKDLTRINTDYRDVRGFVPKALTPPTHVWPLIFLCTATSGRHATAARGRSFLNAGSLRAEASAPRSDPQHAAHAAHVKRPLRSGWWLCAPTGIQNPGVVRMSGMREMLWILRRPGSKRRATSPCYLFNGLGKPLRPRPFNKKMRDDKPPSEASMPTEQIREHPGNRC